MKKIARRQAEDFLHVRVDLYYTKGRIFSESSLSPRGKIRGNETAGIRLSYGPLAEVL